MKEARIDSLSIKSFRGIKNLTVENCGDVNILLGDNNCGKTSLLEAIQFFRGPSFDNILNSLQDRNGEANQSDFTNLAYAFPNGRENIDMDAQINGKHVRVYLNHTIEDIIFQRDMLLDENVSADDYRYLLKYIDGKKLEGKKTKLMRISFAFNSFQRVYSLLPENFISQFMREKQKNRDLYSIHYQSPYSHFRISSSDISYILRNEAYYKVFIKVLQIFDSNIQKVQLIQDEKALRPEVYIQSGTSNPVPLSIYGDGMKKVISIASMIAQSTDGILLIDEIETSLHHSYYQDVFSFLIKACKAFHIQLFITTHNEEVISSFASFNENNKANASVQFYTLRKKEEGSYIRSLSDLELRRYQSLGIEVRK